MTKSQRHGSHPTTAFVLLIVMTLVTAPAVQADKPFPTGKPLSFQTGGTGVFVPANLGVGDPATDSTIIGDGSGLATYDGTPTGKEFYLNGKRVGDGWDRHFDSAQSSAPEPGDDVVYYPYETAPNPDGSGRRIHVMETRRGEVWFHYTGRFTLDPSDGDFGTLISHSDFEIVGGTRLFAGASGLVNVVTTTFLENVFVDGAGNVNAPFRYDFEGTIVLGDD